MKMDMKKLLVIFDEAYDYIYDCDDFPVSKCAIAFDRLSVECPDMIRDFVLERGDYISSDREAAAFMLAVMAY